MRCAAAATIVYRVDRIAAPETPHLTYRVVKLCFCYVWYYLNIDWGRCYLYFVKKVIYLYFVKSKSVLCYNVITCISLRTVLPRFH